MSSPKKFRPAAVPLSGTPMKGWKEVHLMQAEGSRYRYDANADDQPSQQSMAKDLKPAQRKAPTQDQKKVRRQMQRKTALGEMGEFTEGPVERRPSPAKSWNMDGTVTTPHPLMQSALDGGTAPSDAAGAPASTGGDGGSSPSASGGGSSTAAAWWEPDPRKARSTDSPSPEGQPQLQPQQAKPKVKTLERERTEFKPREIEDDGDFDPYLVTKCEGHGTTEVADRESQGHYQNAAQQCHNEAAHPDINRSKAHDQYHRADYSDCWSCCPDMEVAAPGERTSGRIARLNRKRASLRTLACINECRACGCTAITSLASAATECGMCGSPSINHKTATQVETNIAAADGRVLLNEGDQIRLPGGQTTRVRKVRRHETSGDHYYVDTDMGTSVMPYSTRVQVVPNDTQQQSLPGYGDPRANSNSLPGQPQASGGAEAPNVGQTCPVCGGKSLIVSGAKTQCTRCGYRGSNQGDMSFSDQAQQVRVGSAHQAPLSAVAQRATEVFNQMKETPL